jgi:KTSC domain
MDRQPVDSRLIRSVGYDLTSSILEIELLESSRIYRYFDVPYSIAEELMTAESKGAYFNEQIRDMYAFEEADPG